MAVSRLLVWFAVAWLFVACNSDDPVDPVEVDPPAELRFSRAEVTYVKDKMIVPNLSSVVGTVDEYTISPALPDGLVLGAQSGYIGGTPKVVAPRASYTVTARNMAGETTATLSIEVIDAAPSMLTYSSNPATYEVGVAIPPNMPAHAGGAVSAYSVTPALPPGLALDPATGVISGTPTAASAKADYTVKAENPAGAATVKLAITVTAAAPVAPSNLQYSVNPALYTRGVAITPNTPSTSGGAPTMFAVSPALPAGLTLNATTGVITGTPTAVSAAASYTVTASNAAGMTTRAVNIAVQDAAPSNLTYATNPATYTVGMAIAPNTPDSDGGTPTMYSVTPSLPAGLALNPSTGVITGTPTAATATATYTVTASNSAGMTSEALSITVE